VNVLQRNGATSDPNALLNGQRPGEAVPGTGRTGGTGAAIRLTEISKVYGRGPGAVHAVDRLSLTVGDGEFVCLVGASGCGKSTLLSIVAGLDMPSAGQVDTGARRVALLFQEPALFPWLTAQRNVELALRALKVPKERRRRRAFELLEKACEERDPRLAHINVSPIWDCVRSDPRFAVLPKRDRRAFGRQRHLERREAGVIIRPTPIRSPGA